MIPRPTIQATIQRWEYADGKLPKLFHRVRHDALFTDSEWDWSEDQSRAYHFESYEAADQHARELRKAGLEHVFPVVAAPAPSLLRERDARHQRALAQVEASIPSPEEVFAREERRHLA